MESLTVAQETSLYAHYASKVQNCDVLQSAWGDGPAMRKWSSRELFDEWRDVALENGLRKLQMYLHVPFCEEFCDFCTYYKRLLRGKPLESATTRYVDALMAQLEYFAPAFRGAEFQALSVGGGTPSTLSSDDVRRLFGAIRERYLFSEKAYLGVEFRPSSTNSERLAAYRESGFNTVHFGVQSLDQEVLAGVNRNADTKEKVLESVRLARAAGFPVVRAHMILGLKGDTSEKFIKTVADLCGMGVNDITIYTLLATDFYVKKHFSGDQGAFHAWLTGFSREIIALLGEALPQGYRFDVYGKVERPHCIAIRKAPAPSETPPVRSALYQYGDADEKGVNLFALGPTARSYRYGKAVYEGDKTAYDRAFDPDATMFSGRSLTLRDEMVRFVLLAIRDDAAVDDGRFAATFGTTVAKAFPRAVSVLSALKALTFSDGKWRFHETDLQRRFVLCLFFSGPANVLSRMDAFDRAQVAASWRAAVRA